MANGHWTEEERALAEMRAIAEGVKPRYAPIKSQSLNDLDWHHGYALGHEPADLDKAFPVNPKGDIPVYHGGPTTYPAGPEEISRAGLATPFHPSRAITYATTHRPVAEDFSTWYTGGKVYESSIPESQLRKGWNRSPNLNEPQVMLPQETAKAMFQEGVPYAKAAGATGGLIEESMLGPFNLGAEGTRTQLSAAQEFLDEAHGEEYGHLFSDAQKEGLADDVRKARGTLDFKQSVGDAARVIGKIAPFLGPLSAYAHYKNPETSGIQKWGPLVSSLAGGVGVVPEFFDWQKWEENDIYKDLTGETRKERLDRVGAAWRNAIGGAWSGLTNLFSPTTQSYKPVDWNKYDVARHGGMILGPDWDGVPTQSTGNLVGDTITGLQTSVGTSSLMPESARHAYAAAHDNIPDLLANAQYQSFLTKGNPLSQRLDEEALGSYFSDDDIYSDAFRSATRQQQDTLRDLVNNQIAHATNDAYVNKDLTQQQKFDQYMANPNVAYRDDALSAMGALSLLGHYRNADQVQKSLDEIVNQVDTFAVNPNITVEGTKGEAEQRAASHIAQAAKSAGIDVGSIDPAIAAPGGYLNLDALATQITGEQDRVVAEQQEQQRIAEQQAHDAEIARAAAQAQAAQVEQAAQRASTPAGAQDIRSQVDTFTEMLAPPPVVSAPKKSSKPKKKTVKKTVKKTTKAQPSAADLARWMDSAAYQMGGQAFPGGGTTYGGLGMAPDGGDTGYQGSYSGMGGFERAR